MFKLVVYDWQNSDRMNIAALKQYVEIFDLSIKVIWFVNVN